MKNRIYTISLLLSFLVVLSHEMIAHHHHEDLALNFSDSYEQDDDLEHKHLHEGEHQHNHDSQKEEKDEEHNHPFPFHLHITAASNFNIERTNLLESNIQIRDISFLIFTEIFQLAFLKPPNIEGNLCGEPPFLISSLCNPEANALRGPPSIV
jgi:hypothetical protein